MHMMATPATAHPPCPPKATKQVRYQTTHKLFAHLTEWPFHKHVICMHVVGVQLYKRCTWLCDVQPKFLEKVHDKIANILSCIYNKLSCINCKVSNNLCRINNTIFSCIDCGIKAMLSDMFTKDGASNCRTSNASNSCHFASCAPAATAAIYSWCSCCWHRHKHRLPSLRRSGHIH